MSIVAWDIASESATFCVLGTQGVQSPCSLPFVHDGFSFFIASTQVSDASLFVMESTGVPFVFCKRFEVLSGIRVPTEKSHIQDKTRYKLALIAHIF